MRALKRSGSHVNGPGCNVSCDYSAGSVGTDCPSRAKSSGVGVCCDNMCMSGYNKLTRDTMRDLLRQRGLPVSGSKDQLWLRLNSGDGISPNRHSPSHASNICPSGIVATKSGDPE